MNRARLHAFTLIEVLVALSIFTAAAIVLASSYLNVLNSYQVANRASASNPDVKFARAQLLAEPDVELARQGGECDTADGRRLRWTATITPTKQADLFAVTLECEIAGQGPNENQKVKEVFRALRPTWSTAADREKLRAEARDRIRKIQANINS